MNIYIYIIFTFTYVCIYTYVYTYVCIHLLVYIHTIIYIHIYIVQSFGTSSSHKYQNYPVISESMHFRINSIAPQLNIDGFLSGV